MGRVVKPAKQQQRARVRERRHAERRAERKAERPAADRRRLEARSKPTKLAVPAARR